MSDEPVAAAGAAGVELLERAIAYTLGSLHLITPEAMSRPTPCQGWDLHMLLQHMDESLRTLTEAADTGHVDLAGDHGAHPVGGRGTAPRADPVAGAVAALRAGACQLLGRCAEGLRHHVVSVAGRPLTAGILADAGALEIAVHGWDVARACGRDRPIPSPFAEAMLKLAPLLITDADRPIRFAAPVEVSPRADPGDRLVAFLGRTP